MIEQGDKKIKTSKGTQKIVKKYLNNSEKKKPAVHNRLYQNIPLIGHAKKLTSTIDKQLSGKKVSVDEEKKIVTRLYAESQNKDERMNQLADKWFKQSTCIDLSQTTKTQNDKLLYEKLQKDFEAFFDQDLFQSSVQYANFEAFEKPKEPEPTKARHTKNKSITSQIIAIDNFGTKKAGKRN